MSVAAIVLAAGGSQRYGSPKQLAEIDGVPMVALAVAAATAVAVLDPVVVVLGAHAEAVEEALPGGWQQVVRCADWADGMSASLRCGIRAAGPVDALMVLLADQPLVDANLVRRVIAEGMPPIAQGLVDAARPVSAGVPGHPVLLGWRALARHRELRGDRGLGSLLEPARVHLIEVTDPGASLDVDRPADLIVAGELLAARAPGRRVA